MRKMNASIRKKFDIYNRNHDTISNMYMIITQGCLNRVFLHYTNFINHGS